MKKDAGPVERLKRKERNLRGRSRRLFEKPNVVAQNRLDDIRSDLERVEPKETKDPENICMHQHLKYMERAYEEEPVKILHSEAKQHEKDANILKQKIEEVSNGN